jgi:hypothetical protein
VKSYPKEKLKTPPPPTRNREIVPTTSRPLEIKPEQDDDESKRVWTGANAVMVVGEAPYPRKQFLG